jgi:hypothetical protein
MSGIFGFSEREPMAKPLSAERCNHRRGLRGAIELRLTDHGLDRARRVIELDQEDGHGSGPLHLLS